MSIYLVASNSLPPGEIKILGARILSKNYVTSIRFSHEIWEARVLFLCLAVATGKQVYLDVWLSAAAFTLTPRMK